MKISWNIQSLFELQYFVCPSCTYKNHSKQEFVDHAYNFHSESISQLKSITDDSISDVICPWNEIEIKEEISEQDDPFADIHQNGETLENKEDHEYKGSSSNLKNPHKSEECGESYSTKGHLNVDIDTVHLKELNRCELCSKDFATYTKLMKHKKIIHGELLQCKECDKIFKFPSDLRHHISSIHEGNRFQCDTCGLTYKRIQNYKEHILTHNGVKNYQCSICGKEYVTQKQLREHNTRKHGDKNHICTICNAAFPLRSLLVKHDNFVHQNVKNYECKYCKHLASSSGNLKRHIIHKHESHRKVQCTQCDRKFSKQGLLDNHIKNDHVHGNKCDSCGKSFSDSIKLKRHIKTVHEGRKDYKCDSCPMAYGQSGDLKRHKIRAHQNGPK